MLLNPKLSADEKVETLAGLLSHLKGRTPINAPELEFQAAVNKFKDGSGGSGGLSLNKGTGVNLNTASGLGMKKGGSVKKAKPKCMARGGGCEVRGKTKGRFV
jgi:hypothetical protein